MYNKITPTPTPYYVTGFFNDLSLNFYNSDRGVQLFLENDPTDTNNDTYIAKYDQQGIVSWAKKLEE